MPKTPILSRDLLYDTLRDGSIRLLDWCLVNTSLGGMVEPRQLNFNGGSVGTIDALDASYTRLTPMKDDQLNALLGTSGRQLPVDFNVT